MTSDILICHVHSKVYCSSKHLEPALT